MAENPELVEADFIIIGSGVAGLRAALDLAERGRVLILTKAEARESNSRYAQGGIAAAIGESDSTTLHLEDTLSAGAGLCDPDAVAILATEAPAEIQHLVDLGTGFDRAQGRIELGREAAHSRPRVLHAHGDATGMEIIRALSEKVRAFSSVTMISFAFVEQLLADGDRVVGVRFTCDGKTFEAIGAATLIASGGAGQVYRETTNPPVATGDGFALASRAGAWLRDMEFVQFHPTALSVPGLPPFLISEAVRGEGAYLLDSHGVRFVDELAPRDVVSRAIYDRITPTSGVFLDLRHLAPEEIRKRFPHIYTFCFDQGLDITRQPLPVVPAAHYFMGGLYTDLHGRTSLPGLYAAGESASTGVHGANRLASNSLLECVVFGKRAADAMVEEESGKYLNRNARYNVAPVPVPQDSGADRRAIRETAWTNAGIVRTASTMKAGLDRLRSMRAGWKAADRPTTDQLETANMSLVAELILTCALERQESRGAHYRLDFPGRKDDLSGVHTWVQRDEKITLDRLVPKASAR